MKKNVSPLDRSIRAITGVACAYIAVLNPFEFTSNILIISIGFFALINIFTALFSYCPLYHFASISTTKD